MLQYRLTLLRRFCCLLLWGCSFLLLCLPQAFQETVCRNIQDRQPAHLCSTLPLHSVIPESPLDNNLLMCNMHLNFRNSNGVTIRHIQVTNLCTLSHSNPSQLLILRIKAAICFRHSRLRLRTQREPISSSKRQLSKLQRLLQSATEQLLSLPNPAVQFRLDLDTKHFHLCNLPAKLELPYRRLQVSKHQDLLYRW